MTDKKSEINYFKIGAFVLCGVGLIIAALLIFGSSRLFTRTIYIETYFDESVQGIAEGSPVKYRGLRIGYVKELAFTSEKYKDDKHNRDINTTISARSIYVKIAITSTLFTQLAEEDLSKLLQHEVASGLRIKLLPQGITGTTYLDLNYVNPKENPVPKLAWQPENFYLPSSPSMLAQITDSFQYVLQDMRQINFKEFFANISRFISTAENTTSKINKLLNQIDNLSEIKANIRTTTQNFATTSQNLKSLSEEIKFYPAQLLFSGTPPKLDPKKL